MHSNVRASFLIAAMPLILSPRCLMPLLPSVFSLRVMSFVSSVVQWLGGKVQRLNLSRCRWLHPHMISYILLIFRSGLLKESQLHSSVQAWKWFVMAIAMIMSGSITVTSWRSLSRSQQAIWFLPFQCSAFHQTHYHSTPNKFSDAKHLLLQIRKSANQAGYVLLELHPPTPPPAPSASQTGQIDCANVGCYTKNGKCT